MLLIDGYHNLRYANICLFLPLVEMVLKCEPPPVLIVLNLSLKAADDKALPVKAGVDTHLTWLLKCSSSYNLLVHDWAAQQADGRGARSYFNLEESVDYKIYI